MNIDSWGKFLSGFLNVEKRQENVSKLFVLTDIDTRICTNTQDTQDKDKEFYAIDRNTIRVKVSYV